MAKADVFLDLGLNISDSELTGLAKKLKGITNSFANDLKNAFENATPGSLVGSYFSGTSNIISKYQKTFNKNLRPSINDEQPHYDSKERVVMGVFNRLLSDAKAISRFEDLPRKAETIAQATKSGKLSPAQSLGAYGVTQKKLGRFTNYLMYANERYPNIVPESVVEGAESTRQTFLNIGNFNRAASRYSQNKELWSSAVSRTMKYIMNTEPEMVALNEYFGLGFRKDKRVTTFNEKAFDLTDNWAEVLHNIKGGKELLSAGGLSNKDFKNTIKELNSNLTKLMTSSNKLGSDFTDLSRNIVHSTKDFIREKEKEIEIINQEKKDTSQASALRIRNAVNNLVSGGMAPDVRKRMQDFYLRQDKRGQTLSAVKSLGGMVAMKAIEEGVEYGSFALQSHWGESVTRNVYDSRRAQEERQQKGYKAIGTTVGMAVGAAIGVALAPFTGGLSLLAAGAIGAGIGAGIGGTVGSTAGAYGRIKLESDIKSAQQMGQRIRAKSLYGSGYNTFFAQAITDSGIANGEAAMGHLAGSAQAMRGRMMLGQVGEQEMLYMSMMPNYYAALMNGITGPELARIYAEDLNNIGDPSLRYVVGNALGGQEAYTMGSNKYFASNFDKFYSRAAETEATASGLEYGYAMTQAHVGRLNVRKVSKELVNTALRGDSAAFNKKYDSISKESLHSAKSSAENAIDQVFTGKSERPINIYFQVDGETIAGAAANVDTTKTDTIYLQNGFVGG